MVSVFVILQIIFWFSLSVTAIMYLLNSLTDWTDQESIGIMKSFGTVAAVVGIFNFIIF